MTSIFYVITKMFNESSFIESFVRHYLDHGAAGIVLFDDQSDDDSVAKARHSGENIHVCSFHRRYERYDRISDEHRCQELFQAALNWTDTPSWWLFPDVDELIRPGPGQPPRIEDALSQLPEVDGVPCVGLHCLPRIPEDERFDGPPAELLQMLDRIAPPRSFEPPHRSAAAWKTPIWFFGVDAGDRYRNLRLSSGSHLLLGDSSHLRYARPAWSLYHYKMRRVSAYLEHTKRVLARVPEGSPYEEIWRPSHDRVAGWADHQFRLLRLAPVLDEAAIADACRRAQPPGMYFESPFQPGVWGRE